MKTNLKLAFMSADIREGMILHNAEVFMFSTDLILNSNVFWTSKYNMLKEFLLVAWILKIRFFLLLYYFTLHAKTS